MAGLVSVLVLRPGRRMAQHLTGGPDLMDMRHSPWRTLSTAACLAAVVIACADGATEPPIAEIGPPGITIVAGNQAADTIDALLPPLKIVVRDAKGHVLPHSLICFTPVRAKNPPGNPLEYEEERVRTVDSTGTLIGSASAFTADDGTVKQHIRLGRLIGPGKLAIWVFGTDVVDTARFIVTAGRVANVRAFPKDSAVTVGGRMALRATSTDRAFNPLSDPVSYRALDQSLSVTADGVVTAGAPTRSAVIVSNGSRKEDTAWVSVVPPGRFAALFNGSLAILATDGSGQRVVPSTMTPRDPDWTRDGQSLLVKMSAGAARPALYRVAADGTTTMVLPGEPGWFVNGYIGEPIHSFAQMPDGDILAAIAECSVNKILYRFRPGGASATRVSPPVPNGHSDCYDTAQSWPSPSPDGMRVAYDNDSMSVYYPHTVEVRDLTTGRVTYLGVGERPRWSPVSEEVAFVGDDRVWVARADGLGLRAVSPVGRKYFPGVSWSPDGRWLMARYDRLTPGGFLPQIAILEVATGLELPLGYAARVTGIEYGVPAWSPRP